MNMSLKGWFLFSLTFYNTLAFDSHAFSHIKLRSLPNACEAGNANAVNGRHMSSACSRKDFLKIATGVALISTLQTEKVNAAQVSSRDSAAGAPSTTAEAPNLFVLEDKERKFQISLPAGWVQGTAELPGANNSPARPRVISFLDPQNKEINVAVVSYYVQPDQSKLGALGSIEDVSRVILGTSVNLDSEMFSQLQKDVGNGPAYVFDYRIKERHLLTIFAVQASGNGANSLVTVTFQAPLATWPQVEAKLRAAVASFRLNSF